MSKNIVHKILSEHIIEGKIAPNEEIGIRIDQRWNLGVPKRSIDTILPNKGDKSNFGWRMKKTIKVRLPNVETLFRWFYLGFGVGLVSL